MLLRANIQYILLVVKFLACFEYNLIVKEEHRFRQKGERMSQSMNTIRSRQSAKEGGVPVFFLLKIMLSAYILTAGMLLLLAFLLFKMQLTEKPVSVAIIVIYVLSTLFAGFVTGKKMESKRFLWGLIMGCSYFVVLALVSLAVKQSPEALGSSFFTTLALCAGGGMLGGMLS